MSIVLLKFWKQTSGSVNLHFQDRALQRQLESSLGNFLLLETTDIKIHSLTELLLIHS